MSVTRPVLRYFGGKWTIGKWIIENFPAHRTYVEPYAGGASVLLQKPRSFHEVYNDLNCEVVNLFEVLRDPLRARKLYRNLSMTPFSRDDFDEAFQNTADSVEWAKRMIVRCMMGYGAGAINNVRTGFRAKSVRQNSTAAREWRSYRYMVPKFVNRLRGVVIENRPALEIIERFDEPSTLFYLDPPYVHSSRRNLHSGHYGREFEMSDQDHRNLAELARSVHGMVVISGYQCDLYSELYADWMRLDTKSSIPSGGSRIESVWLSPKASGTGIQKRMF